MKKFLPTRNCCEDAPHNNAMYPTADTLLVKFLHKRGAAGDAGRQVAYWSRVGLIMSLRGLVLGAAIVLSLAVSVAGQESPATQSPQAPPAEEPEPVDAAFVPPVGSKTEALEVLSVVRRGHFLRLRLKNASGKNIYSFRMSYHKGGAALLFSFVMAEDKTALAPGEVYKYDYPFIPTSSLVREPLTFEAVLFEDGTGDGEPRKLKSLQDLFLASRKELEHVTAVLGAALEAPGLDSPDGLQQLERKLLETPNYTYGVALEGLAGLTLPLWKETAMRLVRDLESKRLSGAEVNVRDELGKIKDRFTKTLAKYPGTT